MTPVFYEVTATFSQPETAVAWAAWLRDEHLDEVMAAGAISGRVVQLDPPSECWSAQYLFPDRATFDRYLTEHVPRLRENGLKRFPPDVVTYARRSGDVIMSQPD